MGQPWGLGRPRGAAPTGRTRPPFACCPVLGTCQSGLILLHDGRPRAVGESQVPPQPLPDQHHAPRGRVLRVVRHKVDLRGRTLRSLERADKRHYGLRATRSRPWPSLDSVDRRYQGQRIGLIRAQAGVRPPAGRNGIFSQTMSARSGYDPWGMPWPSAVHETWNDEVLTYASRRYGSAEGFRHTR
jgi:hypothetical protein